MGLLILTTATVLAATPIPQGGAQPIDTAPPVTALAQAAPPAAAGQDTAPPAEHEPGQSEIIVTARDPSAAPDPLRALNAQSFAVTQAVDDALVGPLALGYQKIVPSPVRSGIHNFLYNLREPVVFLNFFLQHKIGKALETVGRFALNSTIGVLGVFDMAKRKPFRLPRRGNGFADTLGFYGIPSGPFMFLPIVGPTTVRDLIGGTVDRLVLPIAGGKRFTRPSYTIPAGILGALDHRADFDDTLHQLHDGVPDAYANSRAFYLQRRQAEIDHLRGRDNGGASPIGEKPNQPIRLKSKPPVAVIPPAAAPTASPQ